MKINYESGRRWFTSGQIPFAIMLACTVATVPVALSAEAPMPRNSQKQATSETRVTRQLRPHPAMAPDPLSANRSSSSSPTIAEVVVTAQRYKQRAFDVPISLAIVDSSEIRQQQITDIDNLQFAVPGLHVQDTGVQRRIEIRGVSNASGPGALIGEYLDEADVSVAPALGDDSLDLQTFDLQRVEVLRGPQGTLYGAGSIGGTIRYITNPPNLTGFSLTTDVRATFTQGGAPGSSIEAAVNTPISPGVLGLRFSGESVHSGGWIDQPTAGQKNINGSDLSAIRIQALFQPTSALSVRVLESLFQNSFGPNEAANTGDVFVAAFNTTFTPAAKDKYGISNVTATYDLPALEVLSSTTYFSHTLISDNRSSFAPATAPPNSLIYDELVPYETQNEHDASEELRLMSRGSATWHWTVGGFYKRIGDTEPPLIYYFASPGPPGSPLPPPYPYGIDTLHSESWSGFADTNYRLFGNLTVGAGVRYFHDHQNSYVGSSQSATFNSTDPRFYVQYQINPKMNIYASAAKGFRSGGFNTGGNPPYGPEILWSYELGSKLRLADDRLKIDADVFYSDYDNYVGLGYSFNHPGDYFRNSGTVHIRGVEGDVAWKPGDGWLLSATADYLNGRFVKINATETDYMVGDPVPMAPRYGVAMSVEKSYPLGLRTGYSRVDYSQRPPESYRGRSIGPWYYSQSSYFYLLDFSTGIRWTDSLQFDVFVKNLLNDQGYVDPFVIESSSGRNRPRSFGIELHAEFD